MALNLSTSGTGRVLYAGKTSYDNLTAITVACWVRLDSGHDSQTHDVLSKWDFGGADKSWLLFRSNSTNKWSWEVAYDDTNNTDFVTPSSATAATDAWVHLVATWTPTYRALYVDGVVPTGASDSTSRTSISDTATSVDVIIGGQEGTSVNTFEGDMYQACVWLDYALSADEAAALAAGASPLQIGPSGATGLLVPLDTHLDPYIKDWSPEHLGGTATGSAPNTTKEGPPVSPLMRMPQSFFEEAAGGPDVSGTGAVTLPMATVAGAGTVAISGTGAVTLPMATVSGAGWKEIAGDGAVTLPMATVSGAGTVAVSGAGAATLPMLTVDGAGTVGAGGAISGTGAVTLPMASVSGVGAVAVSGAAAVTLPMLTVAGTQTASPWDAQMSAHTIPGSFGEAFQQGHLAVSLTAAQRVVSP